MVGRIIPTRVGTSEQVVTMDGETQDHPHACGDKTDRPLIRTSREGSSPRVWGQALQLLDRHGEVDHPHACGDKSIVTPATFVVKGSSPRVWGQANGGYAQLWLAGIIPTRVGTRDL